MVEGISKAGGWGVGRVKRGRVFGFDWERVEEVGKENWGWGRVGVGRVGRMEMW